ncbi:MAG: SDR family NAD(P)-dependent oxidoreductase [Desulfobulbaceae bacterium]|nr:SDR family NAD(P)-dependent oxidoreductase [Desulfobulbaceae bacterium]
MTSARWVMVTGTSSGVGRATALLLSGNGFEILATVRNEADALVLQNQNPDHIHPVIIELRDQGMIRDAVRQVAHKTGKDGLYGLVNCAAMLHCGPLEYFPRELWLEQYDVNLFGPMALTQAMLPLIRKANGRIVNIGAVRGGISLPFYGAIASSKIAFEAVNDCLRRELHPFGINVSIIEPGGIATPANTKMRDSVTKFLSDLEPIGQERYGDAMEAFSQWAFKMHQHNLRPEKIAKIVMKALQARRPKLRYRLGWDSRGAAALMKLLPDRWFDKVILKISKLPMRFGAWRNK